MTLIILASVDDEFSMEGTSTSTSLVIDHQGWFIAISLCNLRLVVEIVTGRFWGADQMIELDVRTGRDGKIHRSLLPGFGGLLNEDVEVVMEVEVCDGGELSNASSQVVHRSWLMELLGELGDW